LSSSLALGTDGRPAPAFPPSVMSACPNLRPDPSVTRPGMAMARLTHLNRNSPVRGANSAGSQGTRRASLVAPPPPPRAAALARSVGAPSPQATKRVLHRIRDQCGAETMPIKTLPRCDAPPSGHCTRRPPEPGAHHPDEEQCTESRTVTGGTMHAAIQGLPTQRHPFHAPAQSP